MYAIAAPVSEWPTVDPFKVVIGGQSVAVIATPDDPSAAEADFAQWLAQQLESQLEIDVPIKGASQITEADAHILAIGQAASNSLLADLAQRHVALVSDTYPGPGGYVIEAVSDDQRELLVIGFVDDAGADAASQAWLDLIANETDDTPVFVRRIEIPMFNALPGHLVDEETPPVSMDVLMARPRERWFYRRMPDVPYILNTQLQDQGPEIGALLPQWSHHGVGRCGGRERHGRANEAIGTLAWLYASDAGTAEDPNTGEHVPLNPYVGQPALIYRAFASLMYADRNLRLPDGRFARIAPIEDCYAGDTDTGTVAFTGKEMAVAYRYLSPDLDAFARQWFLDILEQAFSAAISLNTEYHRIYQNQDVGLSTALAFYQWTTGNSTIDHKGVQVNIDDYLRERSQKIDAFLVDARFIGEAGEYDIGYDGVSTHMALLYLLLQPDDFVMGRIFADHLAFQQLIYVPQWVNGALRHTNGYWTVPRHPTWAGGLREGSLDPVHHVAHRLASKYGDIPRQLLDEWDNDEELTGRAEGLIQAAFPGRLRNRTNEIRYGVVAGYFSDFFAAKFPEQKLSEIDGIETHVPDNWRTMGDDLFVHYPQVGFTAVRRPSYYAYTLHGVLGTFYVDDNLGARTLSATGPGPLGPTIHTSSIDGLLYSYDSLSVTPADAGSGTPASEHFRSASGDRVLDRVVTYHDTHINIHVQVDAPDAQHVRERIPFFDYVDQSQELEVDASMDDDQLVISAVNGDGHGIALRIHQPPASLLIEMLDMELQPEQVPGHVRDMTYDYKIMEIEFTVGTSPHVLNYDIVPVTPPAPEVTDPEDPQSTDDGCSCRQTTEGGRTVATGLLLLGWMGRRRRRLFA